MSLHSCSRTVVPRVVAASVAIVAFTAYAANGATAASPAEAHFAQVGISHPVPGPSAGRVLGGLTAQHDPVVIAVSSNGKRIVEADVALDMRCTSGDEFTAEDVWFGVSIETTGSVRTAGSMPPYTDSTGTLTETHTLTGKLDRKRATFSGVWDVHLTYVPANNGQTDQCDSGGVAFRVRL
jgi:hypothetical protein